MNNYGPMLNAYPDSMGNDLSSIVSLLQETSMKKAFSSFYILPSMYNTDLDRGFSVIDYELNEQLAKREDLKQLEELGIDLKLDFILNHASVLSEQFQNLLANGEESIYKDFFIDWNEFWKGHGTMTEEGYILPEESLTKKMFFRKEGWPLLMVSFPNGKKIPYWNTFYQEIRDDKVDTHELMKKFKVQYQTAQLLSQRINQTIEKEHSFKEIDFTGLEKYKEEIVLFLESRRKYLGQMDLNIKSPLVWSFYEQTLKQLSEYGASIVRLDAFAYASKEPGAKNFLNEPDTWEVLERVQQIAQTFELELLPEIHATYQEGIYKKLSKKGYMTYDFFLPGLILHALETYSLQSLVGWAKELVEEKIEVVNMLGCHDGIPLLDLKGLIEEDQIQLLIDKIVERGGYVKNLHGQKNMYYQVNATYYSALGEIDKKMLVARAIQLFMPGKPQVWYLDLFGGRNDVKAVEAAGSGGHKEINRTNLSQKDIAIAMNTDLVKKQLKLLEFRKAFPGFGKDSQMQIKAQKEELNISWSKNGYETTLKTNVMTCYISITAYQPNKQLVFSFEQK